MPRKNPLPPIDLGIAQRLAEFRTRSGLSRREWAVRRGVSPDLIARIELGRMPLRYGEAEWLLPMLVPANPIPSPINPLWLTDGALPIQLDWPFLLPKHDAIGLNPKTRFSEFVASNRELLAALAKDPRKAKLPEAWLTPYLMHWAQLRSCLAQFETVVILLGCVFEFSAERLSGQSPLAVKLLKQFRTGKKSTEKRVLTDNSENRMMRAVQMRELLERVRKFTLARGMKAKLAADLPVPLPRISEWLSGKYEPNGETTLRLLQWVEQQEGQQKKSPESASTLSGRKTQSRSSKSNEKAKSSPKTH